MSPIALTDSQLASIMAAAQPLPPHSRGQFLQAVAERLRDCREIGDGLVGRVVAEVQKRYFDPPILDKAAGKSKWSR